MVILCLGFLIENKGIKKNVCDDSFNQIWDLGFNQIMGLFWPWFSHNPPTSLGLISIFTVFYFAAHVTRYPLNNKKKALTMS